MWGRGFGRGWGAGRGFGRGAMLGYCPWTGLPRGWRWGYGYPYNAYGYGANMQYLPYSAYTYGYNAPYGMSYAPYSQTSLQNEAELLRRRLDEITKRIEDLEGKQ